MPPQLVMYAPLVAYFFSCKERENRIQITNVWKILIGSAFRALNFYIYVNTLALSLTTEMEAHQEDGITFNCGVSCVLALPN